MAEAKQALIASGFVTVKNRCKQWVREVIQATYGSQYDNLVGGDDANEMGRRWQAAGYDVAGPPQAGDVLVKLFEPSGHTGICIGDKVAENSTYWWERHPGDARGARTLALWGPPDVIGRLPEAATHWSMDIGDEAAVCTLFVGQGVTYAPVKRFSEQVVRLLSTPAVLGYDNASKQASINGHPLTTLLVAGKAYAPSRELASSAGLNLQVTSDTRTVAVW